MTDIFLSWDVGAWHCGRGKSQDALCALITDEEGNPRVASKPWRGTLRENFNGASGSELIRAILNHVGLALPQQGSVTIAIDAALGWPEAFCNLLLERQLPAEIPARQADNKLLFRRTDWLLNNNGHRPLSVVQDQISSQSTKGIYFLGKAGLTRTQTGIWSASYEGLNLSVTAIETYPAPCQNCGVFNDLVSTISRTREFQEALPKNEDKAKDVWDALTCALVAFRFSKNRGSLLAPEEESVKIPADEGWIWIPKECYPNLLRGRQ